MSSAPARALFVDEPPDGCDVAYRNLAHPKGRGALAARQRCDDLWRLFQPLADPDFLELLPFNFHQRWFEMYLGASLVSAGLDVRAPTPGRGPDFEVHAEGRRIYIEAVCPTRGHPDHEDAVPEPVYRDAEGRLNAVQVPHDQITLRIASGVRAKLDAFDKYRRKGPVGPDDACIVAVNLRDIPHARADAKEFFYRALYGVGNRYLVIDPEARQVVAAGREHRAVLPRAGGSAEAVAPLLDPEHADVCGILGSSADVGSVPAPFGDDFILMPHASAHVPFPGGLIRRGVEISLRPGEESGSWTVEEADYGAPDPRGPETFMVEHEGKQLEGTWQISGRELQVSIASHGSAVVIRKGAGDPAAAAREIALEMLHVYGTSRRSRSRSRTQDM